MTSAAGVELPTGIVTFLFTDIEGSTRLLQQLGDAYVPLLEEHARRMRAAIGSHDGVEVGTEGDAFFAVFRSPADAIAAAVDAQRALGSQPLPSGGHIKVRMGLHTGTGRLGGDSYAGIDVHRAARIGAAAHGGQVLLSEATRLLASAELPPGVSLRDLGSYRLKDLDQPERLIQLVIDGLPSEFPPPRSQRPGNLAPAATTFVGRTDEIAAVEGLAGDARIVTLTGPGGTGKTRLSLEVGRRLQERFPDGVFFVELQNIREPELVPSAVSRVLGLTQKDENPLALVTSYLRDRGLLLILDNFEQVLDAGPMVADLAAAGDGVRILVTSRAALRVYGEQEFPVPPLKLPDPAHLPSLARLSEYESVELFIARARAVRPDFTVTNESAPAVAQICARLDGLPLAIELAAARIRLLTPQTILSRLVARLDVLSSGAINVPERQRTLRAAIAWSYDLLDPPVQLLLRRLAVFAGGASLNAVGIVCDPDGTLGIDVLDGLEALVGNNLARQTETKGEPRIVLLETIREFGLSGLEADQQLGEVAGRHVAWVEAFTAASVEALRAGPAFEAINTEYPNIQAALRWAIERGNAGPALRICSSVWRFWQRKGLINEGRWWIEQALALEGAHERTSARAGALAALGSLAYWGGDQAGTAVAYEESLDIYREVGDEFGIAMATYNLSFVRVFAGEIDVARSMIRDSIRRFEALGNTFWLAEVGVSLGYIEVMAGNLDEGEGLIRSALPALVDDAVRQADLWTSIAQIERKRGNFEESRKAIRSALALIARDWDATLVVGLGELRGMIEIGAGNPAWGLRLYAGASAMRDRIGGGPPLIMMMGDEEVARARATLGDAEADRITADGQTLSDEEVFALTGSQEMAGGDEVIAIGP